MLNLISDIKTKIAKILSEQLEVVAFKQGIKIKAREFVVEYTPHKPFGDFSSNIAMVNVKQFNQSAQEVAESIVEGLNLEGTHLNKASVRAGFINFDLSDDFYKSVIKNIDESYLEADSHPQKRGRVLVEYVSANPTGPMHIGNARGGAVGDCLSNVLAKLGFEVTREFFINAAGNQIDIFKKSLEARFIQRVKGEDAIEFPPEGYHGDDVKRLVEEFIAEYGSGLIEKDAGERGEKLIEYGLTRNIAAIKKTMEVYRIYYDTWFTETSLYQDGSVTRIVDRLTEKGLTYEKDGALWYRFSGADGEIKDEVLRRSNGNYTYFAADIAYHANKFETRGFERCINIWGADHHGHVKRLKNVMFDLGIDPERLVILLMQVVRLIKGGEVVKMSKRTGEVIALADLLEEVPVDAVRFIFNMREINTHLDFDMDLAIEESSKNPVYYVQYAHARICNILRKSKGASLPGGNEDVVLTVHEKNLIKCLIAYPDTLEEVGKTLDPSLIVKYLIDLAAEFHKFYSECRVFGADGKACEPRLALCRAVKQTLGDGLGLLGVLAPNQM
ncbi:MAG: arginine--tRNA ligase [Oscillospiraceae bacterium]|jgi:arginyl-tRNA synthetase|nr:arginine--tRNA ligase [Oscillospiraceae bacterium]